jgi:hypothetical protein
MRRAGVIGVALILVAAVLVVVGRWERSRWAARQNAGIAALRAAVGPDLASNRLAGFRLSYTFDCLLYTDGAAVYGEELCFDPKGRIVEAIDRRTTKSVFWTLRMSPQSATVHERPALIDCILRSAGVRMPASTTSIPVGSPDMGVSLVPPKRSHTCH